jgi:integrase
MTPSELAQVFELMAVALRSVGIVTNSQAVEQVVAQIQQPVITPAPAIKTLSEWLNIHEKQILEKGYKIQTLRNRKANINHIRRLWGMLPITNLKAHEISSKIRAEFLPDKTSTAQRVLAELRDAYNEAIVNDWAVTNPALHVKLPTHRVKRKRLSFETWKQMREVAKSSRQKWLLPLLLLALLTGQRRGDLVKMKFDDVKGGCLLIEQQKQAGKGYGARISIPLTLRLAAIDMSLGDVIEICKDAGNVGFTLLRKTNGEQLEESSLSIRFAECIREVCEVGAYSADEWPSLHEVRSLSARMYKEQGIDIQTLLGHKNSEMTAIYEDDRGLSSKEYKHVGIK